MWSTEDIVKSYKSAKSKSKQINILAELNGVDSYTIRKILIGAGCDIEVKNSRKKKWTDEILDEMRSLIEEGYSFSQVVDKMSLDASNTTAKQMYSKIHAEVGKMKKLESKGLDIKTKPKQVKAVNTVKKSTPKESKGVCDSSTKSKCNLSISLLLESTSSIMEDTVSRLETKIDALNSSITEKEFELIKLKEELDLASSLLLKLEEIQKGGI